MIQFNRAQKEMLSQLFQEYFRDELDHDLGGFEAEFLVDFVSEKLGPHFYNQGLADALKAVEARLEDISEGIYQLEKDNPLS